MRFYKDKSIKTVVAVLTMGVFATSCNDYLDRAPLSNVTPQDYLNTEADLATYTLSRYSFPTHGGWGIGTFGEDNHTDNQASSSYNTRWTPGEWRTINDGGDWNFNNIFQINYFLEQVLPKWNDSKISGSSTNVQHYIGEAYFLRAYNYFQKVQALGDFPIVKRTYKDNLVELTEASVRQPRNQVARFILADLDSAIMLLADVPPNGKRRISKNAALLLKSRVGLHEGSWLTYHKGTALVPGGPNWPGAKQHPSFSIDIDAEAKYFLEQSKNAAQIVADAVALTTNTKDNGYNSSANPYFTMFGSENLESYPEVLVWRSYDLNLNIAHSVNHYINRNGGNSGYTRGLVESFTMANGLPIYAVGSGYHGDDYLSDVKKDRDNRLQLFMKAPGELVYTDRSNTDGSPILEGNPDIIGITETKYVTGYGIKKGLSYQFSHSEGATSTTGAIVFRAAEAYLNYIEASYLLSGSIDSKAAAYWRMIRNRAGVDEDFNKTIQATVIGEEAKRDLAAHSSGALLSDKVLYNIRRERRLEFIAEGMRYSDLKRWRALDQLADKPYIVEGFKVWGPMQDWYKNSEGESNLIEPGVAGKTANVSLASESDYLRPYRINNAATNLVLNGYRWHYAHYLSPIAINQITLTSSDGSAEKSTIYQNPGWPTISNQGPSQ